MPNDVDCEVDDEHAPEYLDLISIFGAQLSLKNRLIRCIRYDIDKEDLNSKHRLDLELANKTLSFWLAKHYRQWLLLELELNITIRPIQIQIALKMISPPSETKNKMVVQLNMGEGKSSVIIPMLIAQLTHTRQHLIRIFVLSSLFNSNYTYLAHTLGGLLDKRLYVFPFSRDLYVGPKRIEIYKTLMKECMDGGHFVLTLPEFALSFGLKTIELCGGEYKNKNNDDDKKKKKMNIQLLMARSFLEVKNYLEKYGKDILDESDEILSVKYQVVYSVGKHSDLDGGELRWLTVQDVLKYARINMKSLNRDKTYTDSIEFIENEKMPQCYPEMRLLNRKPFEELRKRIFEDFLKEKLVPSYELTPVEKNLIRKYILNDEIDNESAIYLSKIENNKNKLKHTILILRGLLSYDILYFILSKRWKVQYGVNENSERGLWQAVPFRAKDVAAERAQFAHPDIAIGLTQLSYYYSGLAQKQLEETFQILEKSPDKSSIYEQWIKQLPKNVPVDDSIKEYAKLNLADTTQTYTRLFPTLKYHQPVIDYWLSNTVYPKESKEFESRISASMWDLCELNRNLTVGFSGTNELNILLPLAMKYYPMPNLIGTSGKVLANLYCQNNDKDVYNFFEEKCDELKMLEKITENKIPVLLDVGALIVRMSNEEVAMKWLELNQQKNKNSLIEACVFFKGNDLVVMERNSDDLSSWHTTSFETSIYKENMNNKCLIYLDESHCRGTDLRIPIPTKAAVTLGNGLTKDRLVQACMRMRSLGQGHSVCFYASSEVNNLIMSNHQRNHHHQSTNNTNKLTNYTPNCVDVLEWSIKNSLTQIMNDLHIWSGQGLNFLKKNCTNSTLNFTSNNDLDISATMTKYFINCKEECSNKLESMYDHSRVEMFIGDIVKKKVSNYSAQINSKNGEETIFGGESAKLLKTIDKIANFKKFSSSSQMSNEEVIEIEIENENENENENEKEQEAEYELQRPAKAVLKKNQLDDDVCSFVKLGRFNKYSTSFVSFGESLANSSLSAFIRENQAWSRNFYVTRDFVEVVETAANQSDDYLRSPRWIALRYDIDEEPTTRLAFLSSFEVNELMHDFNQGACHLIMLMPRTRPGQRFLFSSTYVDEDDILLPKIARQELAIFSGSLYFNLLTEQDCYSKLIGFVSYPPQSIEDDEDDCLNEGNYKNNRKIRAKGFVTPDKRVEVFGKNENIAIFETDPTEFITKLALIRNFSIVPSSAHHLQILDGKKPLSP